MQTKIYNAYRLTHKNGSIEDINALDLVQAIENMETPETESRLIQAVLVKENVKTLVEDRPTEITFKTIVKDTSTGSIATPAQGTLHVGDKITLQAVAKRNFTFVKWEMNGVTIGLEDTILFTIPELEEGLTDIVFTAVFELSPIDWTTEVEPQEASGAGCLAFPAQGTTEANGTLSLLAVQDGEYTFDHWERNGKEVSTNKLLSTEVVPLEENEATCIYKAVFKKN